MHGQQNFKFKPVLWGIRSVRSNHLPIRIVNTSKYPMHITTGRSNENWSQIHGKLNSSISSYNAHNIQYNLPSASDSVGNNLLQLLHMLDTRRTYHSLMSEAPVWSVYSVCSVHCLSCIFCFHRANWHSSATLTEVFSAISSVVRQMPGYNSQRRGTARTLPY